MPDFEGARAELNAARAELSMADDGVRAASQRAQHARAQQKLVERTEGKNGPRAAALAAAIAAAEAELVRARADLAAARTRELNARGAFEPFTQQPSAIVAGLNAAVPALLFPVRLETRFKTRAGKRELWVRVYPDVCSIDTFEPVLSESEERSAKRYWIDVARAGGIEAQLRGAFRALVETHGSGRAAWIIDRFVPLPPAPPPKAAPDDVVIVVATATPPPPAEQAALLAYLETVARADGASAALAAARTALDAAVTAARATRLLADFPPENLDDAVRAARVGRAIKSTFVVFPDPSTYEVKARSWTRPAVARFLPDRFVFVGYADGSKKFEHVGRPVPSTLEVAPDPTAVAAETLRDVNGDLVVPDALKWLFDFDAAVAAGMGARIDLDTAGLTAGLDRLVVVGMRTSASAAEGSAMLDELFAHHRDGSAGFALVPQGAPTNNTEASGSDHSWFEDPEGAYDRHFGPPKPAPPAAFGTSDGATLSRALGIPPLTRVAHADGTDLAEARAMNVALFAATLGYSLQSMLHPIVSAQDCNRTRDFFTRRVLGRGSLPVVRIGRQPYGVLPTTAFSRLAWYAGAEEGEPAYLRRLQRVLAVVREDWAKLVPLASHVGKAGDRHQVLLDVLGLHASSVEYHQRFAESFEDLFNRASLMGLGGLLAATFAAIGYVQSGVDLLAHLGHTGDKPDVLEKLFLQGQNLLRGPIVDDRPLSESTPIQPSTADGRNYVAWLADGARTSLDVIRNETGFAGPTPTALLYVMLRHAILTGYWDAALKLQLAGGSLSLPEYLLAHREPSFIHVAEKAGESESRYARLYRTDRALTGSGTQTIAEWMPAIITNQPGARELRAQIDALDFLKDKPTAHLERAFAEHVDTCTYRLDAWLLGLVDHRLDQLRRDQDPAAGGTYVGAWAVLEDLTPRTSAVKAKTLPSALAAELLPSGGALWTDPANGGFIHAPSVNQAITSAVLRAGHLANRGTGHEAAFAVDLASSRVRSAEAVLDGMREGQSLGALLGYQLERGLHDRHAFAEVDEFIYALRAEFPLVANRLPATADPTLPIDQIEARNVVDGARLLEHVEKNGRNYPFGLATLPPASPAQRSAIDAEVSRLVETNEAVAHALLAEGVHQALQGNYDRATAASDVLGKGKRPPELEFVRTARSGRTITQRVAVHLPASATAPAGASPRARSQPALDAWVGAALPALDKVACTVRFFDAATATSASEVITLARLGLSPLDLLFLLPDEPTQQMAELDDRVVREVAGRARPDRDIVIEYRTAGPGRWTLPEVAPLVRALRALVVRSRPLVPSDARPTQEARGEEDLDLRIERGRVAAIETALGALRADVAAFTAATAPSAATIDALIDGSAQRFARAALLGVDGYGWAAGYTFRSAQYKAVLDEVAALVTRFQALRADFDAQIAAYDALVGSVSDEDRFVLLRRAERLVTTRMSVLPSTPAAHRLALNAKRATFVSKLAAFEAIANTTATTLSGLLGAVDALLPIDDLEVTGLSLEPIKKACDDRAREIHGRLTALRDELAARSSKLAAALAEHDTAGIATRRVEILTAAAKALFGEEFVLVPDFAVEQAAALEWTQALAASTHADLLREVAHRGAPVSDWLFGVARVREKMAMWERAESLADAFGTRWPSLSPIQLPHVAGDVWLGLEFPATHSFEGERLLYTAVYTTPFAAGARHAGLLVDEWTEVLPAKTEDTGLVFHFDRPSSEPPQTMLLALSPARKGAWTWDDLLDTVNETVDLAKLRAVEPSQVDETPYARFLPATIMAATLRPLTIATNLALVNGFALAGDSNA